MKTKIKLDFKSLEKELDLLTKKELNNVLGGVMTAEGKKEYLSFYEGIRDNQKWGLLSSFDNKYPSSSLTDEQKLKYIRDNEDPTSTLSQSYKDYLLSVDLVSKANSIADANSTLSNSQQDSIQLQMQGASKAFFNIINTGANNTTLGESQYLIVKSPQELRNYFRATGMRIEVQSSYDPVTGQEVITNLILPDRVPSTNGNSTGSPITDGYYGYGFQDVTTDQTVNKGKYSNSSSTLYQVDIGGLSSFLNKNNFSSLDSPYFETSTTDGTTNDSIPSTIPIPTNPGTTHFGSSNYY